MSLLAKLISNLVEQNREKTRLVFGTEISDFNGLMVLIEVVLVLEFCYINVLYFLLRLGICDLRIKVVLTLWLFQVRVLLYIITLVAGAVQYWTFCSYFHCIWFLNSRVHTVCSPNVGMGLI